MHTANDDDARSRSSGGASRGGSFRGRESADGGPKIAGAVGDPASLGGSGGSGGAGDVGVRSWKRAAEVTQNLKARIELMRARQAHGRD